MIEAGRQGTEDRTYGLTGIRIARVCCGIVALLLVVAIGYGLFAVLANYDQIAV